jgi:hypothetical protein
MTMLSQILRMETNGLVIILFFLVAAVVGIFAYIWDKKRREALAALAARLNLRYYKNDPFGIPTKYGDARLCSQGHSKRASNVIAGPMADGEVCYFDYRYTVGSGKNSTTYNKSACAFRSAFLFKRLLVRPENLFDKAAGLIGFEDIDLDSAEFNKKFYVSCEDKKFAYDVLNQRAMEFLLARPGITMEMGWNYVLFNYGTRLSPEEVEGLISTAAAFCGFLPEFLKEEQRMQPQAANSPARFTGKTVSPGQGGIGGIEPTKRREF